MQTQALPLELSVDMSAVTLTDQPLVKDVCAVLATMYKRTSNQGIDSISISCNGQIYLITAKFPQGMVTEICKSDLDTIVDINPLRVNGVSILYDGNSIHIKIKVCGFDHPVTITDTQLVRVVKKRRWGVF